MHKINLKSNKLFDTIMSDSNWDNAHKESIRGKHEYRYDAVEFNEYQHTNMELLKNSILNDFILVSRRMYGTHLWFMNDEI